jgi:hypothetical protein
MIVREAELGPGKNPNLLNELDRAEPIVEIPVRQEGVPHSLNGQRNPVFPKKGRLS